MTDGRRRISGITCYAPITPRVTVCTMRIGHNAYSMQYHVELEADTIPNWGRVPAYAEALEKARGKGALEGFISDAEPLMPQFMKDARRLYDNFMALATSPVRP